MDNFLSKNGTESVEAIYGKEVYFTLFPDKGGIIYKGTLLGYGAYGDAPDHKTFCINVYRGDGYSFIDYFSDGCFKSKAEYEEYVNQEVKSSHITVGHIKSVCEVEEKHIPVKVKVGDMVYPIIGYAQQVEEIREPAFVLKANKAEGKEWRKGEQ